MAKKKTTTAPAVDEMRSYLSQGREGELVYVLRCNAADMSSYNGYKGWPESGAHAAPDWSPEPNCGAGLHGWLWGEGDVTASNYYMAADAKWIVFAAWAADVVEIDRKIKVPRAWVVFCGARDAAAAEIVRLGAKGAVIAGTATAGARGTATAGDAGTATAGYAGTATAGDAGTATAGARGTATAGDAGTATAGAAGTATAGARGTATAGDAGTATAGDAGMICIKRWNGQRYRMHVAHVGEEGIEPNKPYKLTDDGSFVRADKE